MSLLEALCIVFGRKPKRVEGPMGAKVDDYWDEIRVMFADASFLSKLTNFDKDSLNEAIIRKLHPYIANPQFTVQ